MSQRRLFSPAIVESDAFLEMPVSTQALYFHLGMHADDDGFVNPKMIMRMIGASEDDLKVLLGKRFVLSFESGVIVIKHWLIHNSIRKDRYNPTKYLDEKNTLQIKENGAYTELWQPFGNHLATQGKVSKGKVSKDNTVAIATIWNFEEELKKLKEGKRKDYKIIALYWKKKGWIFENKDQFDSALVRELKPAKALKGYEGNQIAVAIKFCEDNYPQWTLESVGKRITDLVNKK